MATALPHTHPARALALRALLLLAGAALSLCLYACQGQGSAGEGGGPTFRNTDIGCGWQPESSLELEAAENYSVDLYQGGFELICISDGARYLLVPEGQQPPAGLSADIALIQQPVNDVYLAATNAMCLVDALDVLDRIALSSTTPSDCSVARFRQALEDGRIAYGGKYNTPDYECIVQSGTELAIESTMIEHSPETREQLQRLGVTVLTEHSSYESTALGRLEWIKLYGELFGKREQAQRIYEEQVERVEEAAADQLEDKAVAFFYINSKGSAVVRQSGDYVAQMIELAGGSYVFSDLSDGTAKSTMQVEMEQFYATAKDADIIIYNTSIDQSPRGIEDLVAKNTLLAQFKAVQEGEVWVTSEDMYQQMVHTGTIISDLHAIIGGQADEGELAFFSRLGSAR